MFEDLEFSFLSFQYRLNSTGPSLKTRTPNTISIVFSYTCEKSISSYAALHDDHRAPASWNLWSPARVVRKY